MIIARLLVERGSFRDKSEDWGAFSFGNLPSPGDRVTVDREGIQYLTVLCVHHKPVAQGNGITAEPGADVVAKWTGSERRGASPPVSGAGA